MSKPSSSSSSPSSRAAERGDVAFIWALFAGALLLSFDALMAYALGPGPTPPGEPREDGGRPDAVVPPETFLPRWVLAAVWAFEVDGLLIAGVRGLRRAGGWLPAVVLLGGAVASLTFQIFHPDPRWGRAVPTVALTVAIAILKLDPKPAPAEEEPRGRVAGDARTPPPRRPRPTVPPEPSPGSPPRPSPATGGRRGELRPEQAARVDELLAAGERSGARILAVLKEEDLGARKDTLYDYLRARQNGHDRQPEEVPAP